MTSEIFWIGEVANGRLGIASRPRGGDWLDAEIQSWQRSGIDSVVSLLMPSEEAEFDLNEEGAVCRLHGIEYRSLPIPDRGVPSSIETLKNLAAAVLEEIDSGRTVVVHCRQGIGRASLVAASAMVLAGAKPDEAFNRIRQARGREVPETDQQREWVRRLAETAFTPKAHV